MIDSNIPLSSHRRKSYDIILKICTEFYQFKRGSMIEKYFIYLAEQ